MLKLYEKTSPYWSCLRKHVDSGYTTLPVAQMRRMERDDDTHFVEVAATVGDWLGYIR